MLRQGRPARIFPFQPFKINIIGFGFCALTTQLRWTALLDEEIPQGGRRGRKLGEKRKKKTDDEEEEVVQAGKKWRPMG